MVFKAKIIEKDAVGRMLMRMSHQILEKNDTEETLCLVGIKTRGIPLSKRLAKNIESISDTKVLVGELDITPHRDDIKKDENSSNTSKINFDITGKTVIIVDDVIYTGRTIRAAMDALTEFGRPSKIQLAELIDRGHREVPIRPDFVGKNIPTSRNEVVKVTLDETDEDECVVLFEK